MYDAYPARIAGLSGFSRVRVIWSDGRLYVARSVNSVVSVAAPAPERSARGFSAGKYRWHKFGCSSCAARSALAKASATDLIAAAKPLDEPEPDTANDEGATTPGPVPDPPVRGDGDDAPDSEATADRATCPDCGREGVKVLKDGSLRKHGCSATSPDGD